MAPTASPLKLKAQVLCDGELAMGPGKAALLEAIAITGSLSAAGRCLGFSYRRTWLLADTMNRCWRTPLITTAHGGSKGGGARLTPLGETILSRYRALEKAIADAASAPAAALLEDLLPEPRSSRGT